MATVKYFDWTFNPGGTWLGHFAGGNVNGRTLGYVYVDEVPGSNGGDDAIGAEIVYLEMLSGMVRRQAGGDDDIDVRYDIMMRRTSDNALVSSGRTSSTAPSGAAYGHYTQLPQDGTTTILDPATGEGSYMTLPWVTTPRSGSFFHTTSSTAAGIQLRAIQYYANNMGGDDDLAEHSEYVFRFGYIPNKTTITASGVFVPANYKATEGFGVVSAADVFGAGALEAEPATVDTGPATLKRVAEGELEPSFLTHSRSWFRKSYQAPENWSYLGDASSTDQPGLNNLRYKYDAIPVDGNPAGPNTWRQDIDLDKWIEGTEIIFWFEEAFFRKWYAGDNVIGSGLNQIRLRILDSGKNVLFDLFDEDAEQLIAQGADTTSGYAYRYDFEVRFPSPSRTTYPDATWLRYEVVSGANVVSASFSRCLWSIYQPKLIAEHSAQFIALGYGTNFEANSWWADQVAAPVRFQADDAGPAWRRVGEQFNFEKMAALPDPFYQSEDPSIQGHFNPNWDLPLKYYWKPIPGDTNGPGGDMGAGPGKPLLEIYTNYARQSFRIRGYNAIGLGSGNEDQLSIYQDLQVGVDVQIGEQLCWAGNFWFRTGTETPFVEWWGISSPSDTPGTGTLLFIQDYDRLTQSPSYQGRPLFFVPSGYPYIRFLLRQESAGYNTRDHQLYISSINSAGTRISPWQFEDGSRSSPSLTSTADGTQMWAGGFVEKTKSGFWAEVTITELQGAQGTGVLIAGTGTVIGDATRIITGDPIALAAGLASMLGSAGLVLTAAGTLIALAATGALAWGSAYRARRTVRQTTKIKAGESTTSGSGTVS